MPRKPRTAKASPVAPVEVIQDVSMDFFEALKEVYNGKKVTKREWDNPNEYILLREEYLTLHTKGTFHAFLVRYADMSGTDWFVINEKGRESIQPDIPDNHNNNHP